MLTTRFLEKYEYIRTLKLMKSAFGDDGEFINELYGGLDGNNECTGAIRAHRILITENERGEVLAMAHYKPVTAVCGGRREKVSYILCVATREDHKRQGMMDELLTRIETELKYRGEPFCFLVPVDSSIYRHRAYVYDWDFNETERGFLFADEGLVSCSAKLLNRTVFTTPDALLPREGR